MSGWGAGRAGLQARLAARVVSLLLALARVASADIILSSAGLNDTLKKLEKLNQRIERGSAADRAEALYQLGMESDALAALINQEIAAHGMQEKALIDLALARLGDLGIGVAHNREKRQFFYDGQAFAKYLRAAPRGERAPGAEFKLIANQFYQSAPTDAVRIVAAAERKQAFLRRYPRFASNVEVSLMLAIDYQDLYRLYAGADDAARRDRYAALARKQFRITARQYPDAEEATIAEGLLKRLESEIARRGRKD